MLIRKIITTKKSVNLREKQCVYTFLVLPNLNKFQIKQQLQEVFPKIEVKKIRTARYKPVLRPEIHSRNKPGKLYTKLRKKVFVELSKPLSLLEEEKKDKTSTVE